MDMQNRPSNIIYNVKALSSDKEVLMWRTDLSRYDISNVTDN